MGAFRSNVQHKRQPLNEHEVLEATVPLPKRRKIHPKVLNNDVL